MTTYHHFAIATGESNNPSSVNTRLSALDSAIGNLGNYSSAAAWLSSLGTVTGGAVTLANGTQSSGATTLTVDSTTGFVTGGYVGYVTSGGDYEERQITVASGTTLTVSATGGEIADNTPIYLVPTGVRQAALQANYGNSYTPNVVTESLNRNRGVFIAANYGATGSGSDERAALQAAIDAAESYSGMASVVLEPGKTYGIGRASGLGTDQYGLVINSSNVTIVGNGAKLTRTDSIATTGYSVLFVGEPDSNDTGDQISNVRVTGVHFEGDDTRHSSSGSAPLDWREAIHIRNAKDVTVDFCRFSLIDSAAIVCRRVGDVISSAIDNLTKCYNIRVTGCDFIASSHTTAGRALIRAVQVGHVDGAIITGNYFEWCDVAVHAATSLYQYAEQVESDTWTRSATSTSGIKRGGRGVTVANNRIYNSSEHSVYLSSIEQVIANNIIWTDAPTYCRGDIKTRALSTTIANNTITAYQQCINCSEVGGDITITGNVCTSLDPDSTGTIYIDTNGLTAYLAARTDYLDTGVPVENISVDNNVIKHPTTAATGTAGIGITIATSAPGDTTYDTSPGYELRNVSVTRNKLQNCRVAIRILEGIIVDGLIDGNIASGKPFTAANFGPAAATAISNITGSGTVVTVTSTSHGLTTNDYAVIVGTVNHDGVYQVTVTDANTFTYASTVSNTETTGSVYETIKLDSYAFIDTDADAAATLDEFIVNNNMIRGFEAMFGSLGTTTVNTKNPPKMCTGNMLRYVQLIVDPQYKALRSNQRVFTNNVGFNVLDRSFPFGNSLQGRGSTNEGMKSTFLDIGSALRYYYDDAAGYKTITTYP